MWLDLQLIWNFDFGLLFRFFWARNELRPLTEALWFVLWLNIIVYIFVTSLFTATSYHPSFWWTSKHLPLSRTCTSSSAMTSKSRESNTRSRKDHQRKSVAFFNDRFRLIPLIPLLQLRVSACCRCCTLLLTYFTEVSNTVYMSSAIACVFFISGMLWMQIKSYYLHNVSD